MIIIGTIRWIHLLTYLVVTSQVLFYLVALSDAFKLVPLENFLEQRKAVDQIMTVRFKLVYYSCLFFSLLVVILSAKRSGSVFFITSIIALACVLGDVLIATKGNMPLNEIVNASPRSMDHAAWESVRSKWLTFMQYRGMLATAGMMALITGLLFRQE